ncbi:MAG: prolipoprotein diacylglyceryl transferase family protein, partial [Polyangia bacterium]
MYPTLFELAAFGRVFAVDAHGLCITIGALLGLWLAVRLGEGTTLSRSSRRDLGLELLLVGMLGARLSFVLAHLPAYVDTCRDGLDGGTLVPCTRVLWLWEGGLYFHGGLVAALAWLVWRTRRPGPSALQLADVLVPGLALAQGIGRLGCWFAGCCYGKPTARFGLRFPEDSVAFQDLLDRGLLPPGSDSTPPLYPVQLWDSLGHVVLCVALVMVLRRAPRPGRVLVAYLVGDALLRIALGPLRGDLSSRPVLLGLTGDTLTTLGFVIAAIATEA